LLAIIIGEGTDRLFGPWLADFQVYNPLFDSQGGFKSDCGCGRINSRTPKRRRIKVRGRVAAVATQQKLGGIEYGRK